MNNLVKTCCIKCQQLDNPIRFCNDCQKLRTDCSFISNNKRLSGGPNPKTLIQPVMAPPIADLDYWKVNNFITHSHINSEKSHPISAAGMTSLYQDDICLENLVVKKGQCCDDTFESLYGDSEIIEENFEGFEEPVEKKAIPVKKVKPLCVPDGVNIMCGYDSRNPKLYNLPVNYAAPPCQKLPCMKDLNDQIFTNIIQPNVYSKTEVVETPVSNIGISYAQPFEPVTVQKNSCGDILFTQRDPNNVKFDKEVIEEPLVQPTPYNVYDPRCTGYGSSKRSYLDCVTGQVRYMYDDVDAVRMPNYITRSKVDHISGVQSYGTLRNNQCETNGMIREIANQAFVDNAIQFRTELQERLMRKNNMVKWQQRLAPINTMSK